ncbi:MAG: hypothetical protein ABSF28_01060 [Terracidiphilus sp.]
MMRKSLRNSTVLVAGLAFLAGVTGCFRVHVDKGANGEDKDVRVDTPFGGVHVNTNQTSAADLGLPTYPGAHQVADNDHDKNKSADIHLGFGEWELHVQAVSYGTHDSQEQVAAFYKKALGRYGDVIVCQGHSPVGTPSTTSEGLTCSDDGNSANVKIDRSDYGSGNNSMELKAGSKRHQHIVAFEEPKDGETRFGLVALTLPAGVDKGKSD